MNKVLSQQEIDLLMESVKSGKIDTDLVEETEPVKIKTYDFKRPSRLSKEYITTLTMLFEEYAKIVSNLITTQVRSNVSLRVASIEQISFDEFLHSVPHFTLMGLFRSEPQEGMQIVEINSQVCLQLLQLLCGSPDTKLASKAHGKESFTDIEIAILKDVVGNFGNAFQLAFRDIVELSVKMEAMETNAQLLQTMSPNEPVIMTTFIIELLEDQTFINLCIPYVFFENMLEKLSFRNWFHSGRATDPSDKDNLTKNLQSVQVSVEVLLGKTNVSIDSFLQLELGDIITLDKPTHEPLVMSIEKLPTYLVKPGVLGNKMAAEVLHYIGGDIE
nr:flagellar motor switch protein FliM [uncultured Trichococcus sp.]